MHDFLYVEKIAEAFAHYRNTLRNVNRVAHATCFLVILKNADVVDIKHEEHETFSLYWASAEEILKNWEGYNENKGVDHWFYFFKKAVARADELGYDTVSETA